MTSSSPAPGSSTLQPAWKFGPFELDTRAGELRRDGVAVKLQPQPFKVLALLVERAGDLVTREELKKALWGEETYVDFERGLNFCVNQARAALRDSAESPQFIQTVPRRGYRFIAGVTQPAAVPPSLPADHQEARSKGTPRPQPGWALVAVGVAFLAVLAVGATYLARRGAMPPTTPASRTMVAVLPLEDLSGDSSPAWFADGLTEELIAQLGRINPNRLGVIARTSAMAYRGSAKTVADIGRELRVSHVLEGSIRRDGSQVRITVQLVSVDDQSPVWSETYDRGGEGALRIQSEVAAQVARALAIELLPARFAMSGWTPTNMPAAHDAFLRGRHFLTRGMPGDTGTAIEHFEDAIRLDPQFTRAHAALAAAYHWSAMSGRISPREAYPRAAAAAREALRLDPDMADAHDAMGIVQLWSEWNAAAAAASFTRAVTLNPSDATAHHDLAWALVVLRRFDEAVSHITRARELDPVSPRASNDIGWLYLHIGQPSEAARACRQTLALHPDSAEAQQCLERAHLQRGNLVEALQAARGAVERGRGAIPAALDEGPPTSRIEALWRWRLEQLESLERERPVSPYTLAMHHIVLGQQEQALSRLEQAYDERSSVMVLLPGDPAFERLHSNRRFIRLLERIRQR